ncbi:MAG TPA: ROK family protein, partial [Alphaproteobacteria bacterium]|nr:ROK family protein [Alphaproteobacteria bacterium]
SLGLDDGKALIEAAAAGNGKAMAALSAPMTAIGTVLAGAVALLDPQTVILSGGVAAAADVVAGPILLAARRHLPPHLRGIGIRAGAFGPRASLVGAACAGRYGPHWGDRHG